MQAHVKTHARKFEVLQYISVIYIHTCIYIIAALPLLVMTVFSNDFFRSAPCNFTIDPKIALFSIFGSSSVPK